MNKTLLTYIAFFFFAACWGAAFPLIKELVSSASVLGFLSIRFAIAGLLFLPFLFRQVGKKEALLTLKFGCLLALLNLFIYICETFSLRYTSASNVAFIVSLNIVIVPVICHIFKEQRFRFIDLLSICVCLGGFYILTGGIKHVGDIGIILALLCAFFIAVSIVCVQKISGHTDQLNQEALTCYQILFVSPLPMLLCFFQHQKLITGDSTIFIVGTLFCAILATALPLYGQIKLQKHISATTAALIFSFEPVFASIFAVVFFDEALRQKLLIGGIVIFLGIIIVPILEWRSATKKYHISCASE